MVSAIPGGICLGGGIVTEFSLSVYCVYGISAWCESLCVFWCRRGTQTNLHI